MNGLSHRHSGLALCLTCFVTATVVAPARAAEPARESAIRVVNCDQKVQSRKRGICTNRLEPADFPALAPGVSWYYNWHFEPNGTPPAGLSFEFVPMVWGDHPESLAGLERYLAAGHKPRQVLAINEPNLRGQAFISPEQTAALYGKVKAVADKYRISMAGPHMAIGSAPGDSITASDPIEKKEVTYTFMVPFLKAFLFYTGEAKTEVRATAFHSYGNIWELRWAVDMMHKEFNRPVWVTEFNQSNVPDVAAARTYLIQATDFLERSSFVEGYAWFKERADDPKISLLEKEPGKLTPLGEAYVAVPVHDADLYYRIPGRLQAENYVALDKMEIWPTNDGDGFTHMASNDPGAWSDYHLQVDQAGTYTLRLRVAQAPGKIDVLKDNQVLATANVTEKSWQTVTAAIPLAAGPQTLRLRFESKDQAINWIEFAQP